MYNVNIIISNVLKKRNIIIKHIMSAGLAGLLKAMNIYILIYICVFIVWLVYI